MENQSLNTIATTEVSEVAKKKESICSGCSNNCRYCSTREITSRLHAPATAWATETIDMMKAYNKGYRKVRDKDSSLYDVLFPSASDITLNNLGASLVFLKKVLAAGNTVLITTKPNPVCIQALTVELAPWKSQILFRLSITAMDEDLLKYWEGNAPSFQQRLIALKDCFKKGFKTSVNIEPALDIPNVHTLVDAVMPYVTDKVWIGKMNNANRCVATESDADVLAVQRIINNQEDEKLLSLYERLKGNPKVCYHDSIMAVFELRLPTTHVEKPISEELTPYLPLPVLSDNEAHNVDAQDFAFALLRMFSNRQARQFQDISLIEGIITPLIALHPELQTVLGILKSWKPKVNSMSQLN